MPPNVSTEAMDVEFLRKLTQGDAAQPVQVLRHIPIGSGFSAIQQSDIQELSHWFSTSALCCPQLQ